MTIANENARLRMLKRTELRRKAIFKASAKLFAQFGFQATTLDMIAEELGYSKANLYHYVKNKEEVLALSLIDTTVSICAELEGVINTDLSPDQQLREFCLIYIASILECPLMGIQADPHLFKNLRKTFPKLRTEQEKVRKLVVDIVHQGVNEKVFQVSDISLAVGTILFTLNSATRWFKPMGKLDLVQVVDNISEIIIGGLINPHQSRVLQ